MAAGTDLDCFIRERVAARLRDDEGSAEFAACIRDLPSTGFESGTIEAVLSADSSHRPDWTAGEALAEAYLGEVHGIVWPWNVQRDERALNASLPGADLVGLTSDTTSPLFVLGEVKTSGDASAPPNVMYGRSGMVHQLDALAGRLDTAVKLVKWLFFRCKGTRYAATYQSAMRAFLSSGCKAIALFGILVRDTAPTHEDLASRGQALSGVVRVPTCCTLVGIYLPYGISDLATATRGAGRDPLAS